MGVSFPAAAYRDALLAMLPRGRAWSRAPDGVFGRLFLALGEGFARLDRRMQDLREEADPRTTVELLSDWERVAGLPDSCTGVPDTISERRVALVNKLAYRGGQSIPYIVQVADRLGYYAEVHEFTSCDAGFGCGDALNGEDWRHAFEVEVVIDSARIATAEFTAGSDAGDRLAGFGALDLECLVDRLRPAHSQVLYRYTVEPDVVFWFDFTSER